MDFRDSPREAAFRRHVRDWLAANVPEELGGKHYGEFQDLEHRINGLRRWQRTLAEAGFVGMTWPPEYGGRGASVMEQAILNEELTRAQAPEVVNLIGVGLVGPTLIAVGTDAQRRRYLPPILTAEEIWCQGFSEPNAGSDLASLRTAAVRDGDGFVITGQKVWTTLAQYASHCLLLARTDPAAPRHRGITGFIVPMQTAGVAVRPLQQMSGDAEFNEVFFDGVRVPEANVVGQVNDGWRVAVTTLMHERASVAVVRQARLEITLEKLIALARATRRDGRVAAADPIVRDRLAQLYVENVALRLGNLRALSLAAERGEPGPIGSIGKLHWSELDQRLQDLASELLGPFSQVTAGSPWAVDFGYWEYLILRSRASTIRAGTSEILRNVIGERILGLSRD